MPPLPRTLRAALDLRLINNSGIGSYLRGLLSGMAQLRPQVEWTFIGTECELPAGLGPVRWIPFDAPLYSWKEFRHYPDLGAVDVFHYPHYNLPLGPRKVPRVVTVHDLFHMRYGTLPKKVYQLAMLRRLKFSKAEIIAISEKTRDDLLAWKVARPERITCITHGPGQVRPEWQEAPRPKPITLTGGHKLRPPWILAVGIDQPHKNLDFLIRAYAMWHMRKTKVPPLLWVGTSGKMEVQIPSFASDRIFIEPYRPEGIEDLYAGASALVFPSLDEGFGFPPLEAMTRGVPVLCASRRPMTDLLGDAPIWFDPREASSLWRALDLLQIEDNQAWRDGVIARGQRVAAQYSWLRTAQETFALYAKAAGLLT